jgi:phosphatidylglycerol:prolipoprotein diacylglycerol transferase
VHPVLLRLGPLTLGAYSAMLALSFLLGILLASRRASRRAIDPNVLLDVGLLSLVLSIAGARALHVAFHLDRVASWRDAIALSSGGLSMYGGVIAAMGGCWLYLRRRGVRFLAVADVAAPSLALGLGVTRVGCFLNGCCYGRPTALPFGVHFPVGSHAADAFGAAALHPTQLYSSATGFLILLALLAFERQQRHEGQVFGLFLVLDAIGRFGLDFLRSYEASVYVLRGVTVHQLITAALFTLGVLLLARGEAGR